MKKISGTLGNIIFFHITPLYLYIILMIDFLIFSALLMAGTEMLSITSLLFMLMITSVTYICIILYYFFFLSYNKKKNNLQILSINDGQMFLGNTPLNAVNIIRVEKLQYTYVERYYSYLRIHLSEPVTINGKNEHSFYVFERYEMKKFFSLRYHITHARTDRISHVEEYIKDLISKA